MNPQEIPATPATQHGSAPPSRPVDGLGVMATLVRREFWEHRSLWVAPAVVALLLALSALPATSFNLHPDALDVSPSLSSAQRVALFTLAQWALAVPLYLTMAAVLTFYLLDCLYAERKDRSILFWKSLPVSDARTVLSKLLVALVVVPLGVYVLALVSHLLFSGLWELRVAGGGLRLFAWNTAAWAHLQLAMLLAVLLGALWYAPVAALLLLVSAWVKRSPVMWITLAAFLAPLLEHMVLGTDHLSRLISYRMVGIWGTLGLRDADSLHLVAPGVDVQIPSVAGVLQNLHFGRAFLDIDLWLGVAVAAALLYATIRIRRYRDDT